MGGDAFRERREVAPVERLRAVAQRRVGVLVDLDEDPVGADRGGGAGERLDQAAIARRVSSSSASVTCAMTCLSVGRMLSMTSLPCDGTNSPSM